MRTLLMPMQCSWVNLTMASQLWRQKLLIWINNQTKTVFAIFKGVFICVIPLQIRPWIWLYQKPLAIMRGLVWAANSWQGLQLWWSHRAPFWWSCRTGERPAAQAQTEKMLQFVAVLLGPIPEFVVADMELQLWGSLWLSSAMWW